VLFAWFSFKEPVFVSPPALLAFLASLAAVIFALSTLKRMEKFFRFFPPLIWMYFLPMLCSSFGVIPNQSPLYSPFMNKVVLPIVLVLLLVPTDTRAIARLGPKAIVLTLFGTAGTVIGATVSFFLYTRLPLKGAFPEGTWFTRLLPEGTFPEGTWKGVAALGGSWIGGSTDFMAVATSLELDPTLMGKLIVVDTICAYTLLGLLVALIGAEHRVDRWNRADNSIVESLKARLSQREAERARPITRFDFALIIGLALALSQICLWIGGSIFSGVSYLESESRIWATIHLTQVISAFGWGVLLIMLCSVLLSLTQARNISDAGATPIGYYGLYLFLTSIGAQADLRKVEAEDAWLFVMGAFWLMIHITVVFIGVRLLRAPLFLGATASMANVGGTASAPVVAAAFHPSLASVGLVMAILCGVIGVPISLLGIGKIAAYIAGVQ
jgi:uncharacterized membrane protein